MLPPSQCRNSLNIPCLSGELCRPRRRPMLAKGLLWTTVTLALAGLPQGARAQADQPTLLGSYVDWGAYSATPGGKKVCFALAKPKTSTTNPPGRKRDPAYLFIATRPDENVRNEVSVIIGYAFKESSDATAEIASAKFAMDPQKDGAWIKDATEETRMLDAMRKGSD